MVEPGEKRSLDVWKDMLKQGELKFEEFKEICEEPWFESEILSYNGMDGLEEYRELLKTPAQRRQELGIDQFLTSQKKAKTSCASKKRFKQLARLTREPLRKEARDEIRKLKLQGHSLETISNECIRPVVGRGKKFKKNLRDGMAAKLAQAKKDKAKADSKSAAEVDADDDEKVLSTIP